MKFKKVAIIILVIILIRVLTILAFSGKPVKLASYNIFKGETASTVPYGKVDIICTYEQVTGSRWKVIGYNNKKVIPNSQGYEYIAVMGKDPEKELSDELILYAQNIFEIRGKIVENDNLAKDEDSKKLLIADSWDILYPIKRGDSYFRLFPPRFYLSDMDFK